MANAGVLQALRQYVDRGVLTNFSADDRDGFGFVWLSGAPMRLRWSAATRTIMLRDVLPNVPARSEIYRELRDFLRGRTNSDLPEHRRINPAAFEPVSRNRNGQVSLGLRVVGGAEEEAVHKLLLVTHEVFLMMNDRWVDYMHEEFGTSEE